MTGPLEAEIQAASPFATRVIQYRSISLEEAERDAVRLYYGSLTKRTLVTVLTGLSFLSVMGYSAVNARSIAMATEFKVGGTLLLLMCAAGIAYVVYEYRRKQRIFVFEDSFAVERRFRFDVELVPWTDVAKLYCTDRTTETKFYIFGIIPVGGSKVHHGKLRIVLVDGREVVITNRVRDFSAMATQFVLRTKAAQLAPCTRFLIEGGTLDFGKLGLTSEGFVYKRKFLGWNEIQRISLNQRGILVVKSAKRWLSPRFSIDTLPNAALLLELISSFGCEVVEA